MLTIGTVICLITALLIVLFGMNVIACGYALGRMHAWLRAQGEPFGGNDALRNELVKIKVKLDEERY